MRPKLSPSLSLYSSVSLSLFVSPSFCLSPTLCHLLYLFLHRLCLSLNSLRSLIPPSNKQNSTSHTRTRFTKDEYLLHLIICRVSRANIYKRIKVILICVGKRMGAENYTKKQHSWHFICMDFSKFCSVSLTLSIARYIPPNFVIYFNSCAIRSNWYTSIWSNINSLTWSPQFFSM